MAALLASPLASGCFLVPLYAEPLPPEAERHVARTADGWNLALVRYRPAGRPAGRPVLLCHGITSTGRHMDLDAQHSLARFLAARGRDAWTLTLRDAGESDRADPSKGRHRDYTVDTYAGFDLPAAVAAVRDAAGAPSIDYVGHSLGGIVLYAYLARGGDGVGAAATLGTPARFRFSGRGERIAKLLLVPLAAMMSHLPLEPLAHSVMPLHGELDSAVERIFYNADNVSPATWKRLIAVGTGQGSSALLGQMQRWIEEDVFRSADGSVDYAAGMARIRIPVMVVAGKVDHLVPVAAAKAGYERLGGPRAFFIAGVENGLAADYGHMDLVIGDRAAMEVWTRVAEFLDRHG